MKKAVKPKKRAAGKVRRAKAAKGRARNIAKSRIGKNTLRKRVGRQKTTREAKGLPKRTSKSAPSFAAGVLSRRAAASAAKSPAAGVAPRTPTPISSEKPARQSKSRQPQRGRPTRSAAPLYRSNRELVRVSRVPQFAYMRAPGTESAFNVGDPVEVFCDHELEGERVRGWVRGVVVQVDNKLVAVQFRSNVFLTDGWMVPDRILWYSLTSDQIRASGLGKRAARKAIPEY